MKATADKKMSQVQSITDALAAPFELDEIKFKPQVVKGNRAMALAYVDARVIQDRLDNVLGVEGWQDEYTRLEDGSVICKLRLRLGGEWITKMDVGSPSEQPDGGDRTKAAFSDSLKRAAVKFGIGRYLYRLPSNWCDYDPAKKKITSMPRLPDFALPEKAATIKMPEPASSKQAKPTAAAERHSLPAHGEELQRRLHDYDAKLAAQGICGIGALLEHLSEVGVRAAIRRIWQHGRDRQSNSPPKRQDRSRTPCGAKLPNARPWPKRGCGVFESRRAPTSAIPPRQR